MMRQIGKLARSQRGQGMTEYIIIAILVALVVMFEVNRFGGILRNRFGQAVDSVSSVGVVDTNVQKLVVEQGGGQQKDTADEVAMDAAGKGGGDAGN